MKHNSHLEDSFFIKQGNALHKVDYAEVAFVESDGNYVFIHTLQQRRYALKISLKKLGEKLPYFFCRCHKGYLVNMQMIADTSAAVPDTIKIMDREIPIGRAYKKDVLARLKPQDEFQ